MAKEESPAFQFYVKEWRSSRSVARMTYAQRGMYLEMLLEQWENFSLPDCPAACADLLGGTEEEWREAWPVLRRKFVDRRSKTRDQAPLPTTHDPRRQIINLKLEEIRKERRNFKRDQQKKARSGGLARARSAKRSPEGTYLPARNQPALETGLEPGLESSQPANQPNPASPSPSPTASPTATPSASASAKKESRPATPAPKTEPKKPRPVFPFPGQTARFEVWQWQWDRLSGIIGDPVGFNLPAWLKQVSDQETAVMDFTPKDLLERYLVPKLRQEIRNRRLTVAEGVVSSPTSVVRGPTGCTHTPRCADDAECSRRQRDAKKVWEPRDGAKVTPSPRVVGAPDGTR